MDSNGLDKNLEIIILTYNRHALLERTLSALRASQLRCCKISVLNNASMDNTAAVLSAAQEWFTDFQVITHTHNIGLGANYLRGVELATRTYCWVLADDDTLLLEDLEFLIESITTGRADLICTCGCDPEAYKEVRGLTVPLSVARGHGFLPHATFGFIPSMIFKKATLGSEILFNGYKKDKLIYPQFSIVNSAVDKNLMVAFCDPLIVQPEQSSVGMNRLEYHACWLSSAGGLLNKADVIAAQRSICNGADLWRWLLRELILGRYGLGDEFWSVYFRVLAALSGFDRLIVGAFLPVFALPRRIFWGIERLYWATKTHRFMNGAGCSEELDRMRA